MSQPPGFLPISHKQLCDNIKILHIYTPKLNLIDFNNDKVMELLAWPSGDFHALKNMCIEILQLVKLMFTNNGLAVHYTIYHIYSVLSSVNETNWTQVLSSCTQMTVTTVQPNTAVINTMHWEYQPPSTRNLHGI